MQLNEERTVDEENIDEKEDHQQSLSSSKTYKSFRELLFRILNLCLASFYFGYSLGYLGSFIFEDIAMIFQITQNKSVAEGLLQGCIPIGGGIGALSSSILIKKFSRINSILIVNLVALIAGILVLIPDIFILFIGRSIQGMCVGVYSALIPLIIKQFSPLELAGTFGALNQTFIATGVFTAYVFQLILSLGSQPIDHWRLNFGLTLITITIQSIMLRFVFNEETPRYYMQQSEQEKCMKIFSIIYKQQFIQQRFQQMKEDLNLGDKNSENITIQKDKTEKQMQQVKQSNQLKQKEMSPIVLLQSDSGQKLRIKIAIHLAILQQLVGINSVIAYGAEIARKVIPSLATAIPSFLNFEQILMTIVSSYLLSKFGRKIILQLGTLTALGSLLVLSLGFILKDTSNGIANVLIIVGLIIFMGNFGISLGPLVWLYIAEIIQPKIIPFSTLANWSASAIVIITFPILSKSFGTPVPLFLFFAAWSLGSYCINRKYLLETKGKTEKQIKDQYKLL